MNKSFLDFLKCYVNSRQSNRNLLATTKKAIRLWHDIKDDEHLLTKRISSSVSSLGELESGESSADVQPEPAKPTWHAIPNNKPKKRRVESQKKEVEPPVKHPDGRPVQQMGKLRKGRGHNARKLTKKVKKPANIPAGPRRSMRRKTSKQRLTGTRDRDEIEFFDSLVTLCDVCRKKDQEKKPSVKSIQKAKHKIQKSGKKKTPAKNKTANEKVNKKAT